jgi:hypothetical protein
MEQDKLIQRATPIARGRARWALASKVNVSRLVA